jgi:hypothetical protein
MNFTVVRSLQSLNRTSPPSVRHVVPMISSLVQLKQKLSIDISRYTSLPMKLQFQDHKGLVEIIYNALLYLALITGIRAIDRSDKVNLR